MLRRPDANHRLRAIILVLFGGFLGLCGCSKDSDIVAPPAVPATPATPADKTDYDTFEGVIGGSYVALYRPAQWNGHLVIVARGYYSPVDTPAPPGSDEFFLTNCRDGMLELGYGVAYTSYPSLGWSVKDGMIALHQLRGLFTAHFGRPDDTYLAGLSMGALMVVGLAERYPNQYAGALAESGPLAGAQTIFAQVYGVRALFDYYFPGVMPGTVLTIPPDVDVWGAIDSAINAMVADPASLLELASIQQLDLRYDGPEELITIIMWHLYLQLTATNELVERIGGSPLDNASTWYSGTSDDMALNAGVARFAMTPQVRKYLQRYYQPSGQLEIPVLTLHNTRDPLVPLGHEEAYAALVASNGSADLLRQETVDRQDHSFTPEETIAAFQELVFWVQNLRSVPAQREESVVPF